MARRLTATPLADLAADVAGAVPLTVGIGPGGVAVIGVDEDDIGIVRGVDAGVGRHVPRSRTVQPYDATVAVRRAGALRRLVLRDLELAHPRLVPLADGGLLVVGARCAVRADGAPEANAEVRDPDGDLVRAFSLGDGIADVQVDADGRAWVAYLDEGVEDAAGFGDAGLPCLGEPGLVVFDAAGAPVARLQPAEGLVPPRECRALAVAGREAWALCEPDGRLVHVGEDGSCEPFACPLAPLTAVAVDAERGRAVVALGTDDDDRALALCSIEDGWLHPVVEIEPVDGDGRVLRYRAATARGPLLHLIVDGALVLLDVRDLRR